MASRKRCSYASEIETSSDSEDTVDDQEYTSGAKWSAPHGDNNFLKYRSTKNSAAKRAKCSSRNALLARENRLKKKLYIQGLEGEIKKLKHSNKTLQSILDNQSCIVTELRKEIKYLKSVVANSSDLTCLLRTVNCSTGMSVTTSLDKSLTLRNNYVPKNVESLHPWAENFDSNMPDIFDDALLTSSSTFEQTDNFCPEEFEHEKTSYTSTLKEHNYTVNSHYEPGEDVGVCLHVSKHKVSLEFCAGCSEKAAKTWGEVE